MHGDHQHWGKIKMIKFPNQKAKIYYERDLYLKRDEKILKYCFNSYTFRLICAKYRLGVHILLTRMTI